MRIIKKIHIHCSASDWGSQNEIDKWHRERGWRSGCGYNFVINNGWIKPGLFLESMDGQIEVGRDINTIPASIKGHNTGSIAICLIGNENFTSKQLESLTKIIEELKEKFKLETEDIVGHYELDNHKTCPNINMENYRKYLDDEEVNLPEFEAE